MRKCNNCNSPVNEDSKFCTVCGAPISDCTVSTQEISSTARSKKKLKSAIAITVIMLILCIAVPVSLTLAKTSKVHSNTELGNKYLMEGNYQDAILAFDKVVSIDKKNVPARIGLAKASMAVKDYPKAQKALEEIFQIDKENKEAQKLKFDLYLNQAKEAISSKKYDAAAGLIKDALNLNSKEISFYLGIAETYIQQLDISKAIDILKTGVTNTGADELKKKLEGLYKDYTGNTSANIMNYGYVVEKDNYLYICNNDAIYRVDKNNRNSKLKLLNTEGSPRYLNIYKEYLYFASTSSTNKNNIIRVKLDGSEPKTLATDGNYSNCLTFKNGRLYYINQAGNIVTMDIEGQNAAVVGKDKCGKMCVGDEWIFFTNENDIVSYSYTSSMGFPCNGKSGKIYRIKLDGSVKEKLSDDGANIIFLSSNYLYYDNISDGDELISEGDSSYYGKLYRMNIDGTDKKKLLNFASWALNIDDSWIYANHDGELVKVNGNSGVEQAIGKNSCGFTISVADNEIFFTTWYGTPAYDYIYNQNDTFAFYSIKTDKTSANSPAPAQSNNTASNTKENTDYIIPYSSERKLTEADLVGLNKEQLGYARNEIYARHGYVFQTDTFKKYFESKSWYNPNPSFKDDSLSDIEKYNAGFIKDHE